MTDPGVTGKVTIQITQLEVESCVRGTALLSPPVHVIGYVTGDYKMLGCCNPSPFGLFLLPFLLFDQKFEIRSNCVPTTQISKLFNVKRVMGEGCNN